MSFQKLEKVEGKIEKCPMCNIEMKCVKIPASGQYPEKLQWQTNGRAHYNFDYKTKGLSCNAQEEQMEPKKFEFVLLTDAKEREKIAIDTRRLLEIRHIVEDVCKGTSQENNQAAIGQLLNLLLEKK